MLSERAGDEFLASVSGASRAASRRAASRARPSSGESRASTASTARPSCRTSPSMKFTTSTRCASSWTPWLSATAPWASSTICTTRCPTAPRTISPPPSPRLPEPPHHRHRPRGHPLRGADTHPHPWTSRPSTALPPTGSIKRASRATISWTSGWHGSASCWKTSASARILATCSTI